MRGALFLLAVVVALPYALLAGAFILLDQAISAGKLWAVLTTLLSQALWIVPWGMLGFACASVGLAVLGLVPRTRGLGGLLLCLIASASIAVLLFKSASALDMSEAIVLLPCLAVAVYGGWLAYAAWRSRRIGRASMQASA